LILFLQILIKRFKAESERDVIRIVDRTLLFAKSGFVDNAADQDEIAGFISFSFAFVFKKKKL
jgi:hypothetical protein